MFRFFGHGAILLQCETVEKGRCRAWLKVKSRVSTSPPYRIQYYIIYKNIISPPIHVHTHLLYRATVRITILSPCAIDNPPPHHPGRVTDCDHFTEDFHWVFSRPELTKNTINGFGWKCPYGNIQRYTESKTIAILFSSECDYEKYTDIRSVQKSALNSNTDLVWTASGDCMTGSSTPRPRYTLSFLPLLVHYRRLHLSFPLHGIRPNLGYCWVDVFGTCRNQKNHQF